MHAVAAFFKHPFINNSFCATYNELFKNIPLVQRTLNDVNRHKPKQNLFINFFFVTVH